MDRKLLALYGLKFNPFSSDVPVQALQVTPKVKHFCWRVGQLLREGGFALITGDPGTGKSVSLRLLAQHFTTYPEVKVGTITHAQSRVTDFYRELGDLFGVELAAYNRWGGFKALREKWRTYIETTSIRPLLLIDEAQEMLASAYAELRALASTDFDSRTILTVVLCGDTRLCNRFRQPDLLPIGSRIRARMALEYSAPDELRACLTQLLEAAGNTALMTPDLCTTLCEHAAGNCRTLMNMANDLLAAAAQREYAQLDEKLFFEVFSLGQDRRRATPRPQTPPAGQRAQRADA